MTRHIKSVNKINQIPGSIGNTFITVSGPVPEIRKKIKVEILFLQYFNEDSVT